MRNKTQKTFFSRFVYFVNTLFAVALLISYVLPYVSPNSIEWLSVLSLVVPILILVNLIFLIYWVLNFKKHFIVSGLVLLLGVFVSSPLYKLSAKEFFLNSDLKLMSYNVRMFNRYDWIEDAQIPNKISKFIHQKKPDILAVQEYYKDKKVKLNYKYQYFSPKFKHKNTGLVLFSNYKIINQGSLNFEESANNTIYVDILKNKDTLRVYNIHLQSLKINPKKKHFGQENSEKLLDRLKKGFFKQVPQVEKIIAHQKKFKGKIILCGDFNNTAYSWAYKQLAYEKKDAFVEAGKGFGKTFDYSLPLRIDFILVDKAIEVNNFNTYPKKYSDHYPIMARIKF